MLQLQLKFAAQHTLHSRLLEHKAHFDEDALSNEHMKKRAEIIALIKKDTPDIPETKLIHLTVKQFENNHPSSAAEVDELGEMGEDARKSYSKAGFERYQLLSLELAAKPSTTTQQQLTAQPQIVHVATTAHGTNAPAVTTLRTIHAAMNKLWTESHLRTPKDGGLPIESNVARFAVAMLNSAVTPSFSDAEREAGLESLRQALLSSPDMQPLFHTTSGYAADMIFSSAAAPKGSVGANAVAMTLAVLSVMFSMKQERSRSDNSLPAALAIEVLLGDVAAEAFGTAPPVLKQDDLFKITLSVEVVNFMNRVKNPTPHMLLGGSEWGDQISAKRPRRESQPSGSQSPSQPSTAPSVALTQADAMMLFHNMMLMNKPSTLSTHVSSSSPSPAPHAARGRPRSGGQGGFCRGCFRGHSPTICWHNPANANAKKVEDTNHSRGGGGGGGGGGGYRGGNRGGQGGNRGGGRGGAPFQGMQEIQPPRAVPLPDQQ